MTEATWQEIWKEYQKVAKDFDFEPRPDDLFIILDIIAKRKLLHTPKNEKQIPAHNKEGE